MNAKRCILISSWAALVLLGWLTWRDKHALQIAQATNSPEADAENPPPTLVAPELRETTGDAHSVHENWLQRWREAAALDDEAQRDQAKEALIDALAQTDPLRAIDVARNEPNEALRPRLMESAMRGWGQTDPEAALAWVAAQSMQDSGRTTAAVFHGAARNPDRAIQLANNLSLSDPSRATDHALYLIAALAGEDAFSTAADFASTSAAESRAMRISDAYSRWANKSPEQALVHATQLGDPETRKTAAISVLLRWAYNDAPAAAQYALSLTDSDQRRFALSKALPIWVAAQPVEAAVWMSNVEPSPELDLIAASIATRPRGAQKPEVSASWAENILEPNLRVQVTASVVHKWAETDPAAARRYAETSPSIPAEERAAVLAALKPGFEPVSFTP
jgi:hypothetical protein